MLGFFDPISAGVTAGALVGKIEQFLGIGAGRREADQIVPFQNEVFETVLRPIIEAKDSGQALSYAQLKAMVDALDTTERAWLRFLHETDWSDGRAAVQAEDTLDDMFASVRNELVQRAATAGDNPANVYIPGPINTGPSVTPFPDPGWQQVPVYTQPQPFPAQSSFSDMFSNPWVIVAIGVGALLILSPRRGR
jgi:hypothetical protein